MSKIIIFINLHKLILKKDKCLRKPDSFFQS